MDKPTQRALVLQRRNQLGRDQIMQHSRLVCAQLRPYIKKHTALYLAYGTEIDVASLCDDHTKKFAIPRIDRDKMLRFYEWDANAKLVRNPFGIDEPVDALEMTEMDVIIVPLVAFDADCNRLGHGKGYYDQYLKDYHGIKIGVAHACQRVEHVICEKHDQPLDMVITEEQIYKR